MAIVSSGTVSLSDIQTEFGGVNPISISEYYRNGLYTTSNNTGVPTSGEISISDFFGATDYVPGSITFSSPGTYTWTIPSAMTSVTVTVNGGDGGGGSGYYTFNSKLDTYTAQFGGRGGTGATAGNTFAVSAGNTLTIVVGAGGAGGPAPGLNSTSANQGGGGGTSSVTYLGVVRSIAGGGGGALYQNLGTGGSGGYNNSPGGSGAAGFVEVNYS